jgi:hypothetical protein
VVIDIELAHGAGGRDEVFVVIGVEVDRRDEGGGADLGGVYATALPE